MPIITVKFKETPLADYRVEAGKTLTIGRKEENDVVIDNLAVSGYHAKIDTLGEAFLLTDLQSKNGSFVNERKIVSHRLEHGDVITIGKHTLTFTYAEGESRPDTGASALDQTMVMDTDEYRAMLQKSAPPPSPPAAAPEKKMTATLVMLAGGTEDIDIHKKLFKIGKGQQSDLIVSGLLVGQTAATISHRPGGYHLNYVEGMSKPKVNGKTIVDAVLLKEFDIIEIGKTKMQLILKPAVK